MPNWVFNTLTIEGEPSEVSRLKSQVAQPFTRHFIAIGDLEYDLKETAYTNPVFAFWNIIKPTNLEEYNGFGFISRFNIYR